MVPEERSHKFSHAYNTGRMWREKKDQSPDAKAAKALRSAFIRRHCKATFVVVPKVFHAQLPALELAVQDLASSGMRWTGVILTFVALPEPRDLVDAILNESASLPNSALLSTARRQGGQHALLIGC